MNASANSPSADATTPLSQIPVLVCGVRKFAWADGAAEAEMLPPAQAQSRALAAPPLVCHRNAVAQRLRIGELRCYDILELYALAHPTRPDRALL